MCKDERLMSTVPYLKLKATGIQYLLVNERNLGQKVENKQSMDEDKTSQNHQHNTQGEVENQRQQA